MSTHPFGRLPRAEMASACCAASTDPKWHTVLCVSESDQGVFGCKPIRNGGSFVIVIKCLSVANLDSFNNNNEGAKPSLLCGAEQSSAPRSGGGFNGNVVAVTMQKRLALLLLLTALRSPLLTMPGRNQCRRHISLTPQEAEEPVRFRRRSDNSSTEATGCAGHLPPK